MLLSSLTADELERLAFVCPETPGIHPLRASTCEAELRQARCEIAQLEKHVQELEDYNEEY